MRYSYRIIHENEGYSNESNESINTKHPIEKDLSDYLLIFNIRGISLRKV